MASWRQKSQSAPVCGFAIRACGAALIVLLHALFRSQQKGIPMTDTQQAGNMQAFLKPFKLLADQRDRWLSTVTDAQLQLLQLQTDFFADAFSDSLPVLLPPLNIDGVLGAPWRLGMLYPAQAERVAKGLRDGFEIISRAQSACVNQSCDNFIALGQRASVTQSQVNGLVLDRRVSAQLISFENRRKAGSTQRLAIEGNGAHEEHSQQARRRQASAQRAS
ncbi:hypothetical protein [Roseateles albus]|uniref:Phasin domain-containing protein n=1 Tax=Roseateles albus TaxID=2987525 RepID=A0ABT5KKM0_9BURK|nr:hypothetical protein [Roseateles albus]MDC8774453.1 hypothetical protein [Roseateles albus]